MKQIEIAQSISKEPDAKKIQRSRMIKKREVPRRKSLHLSTNFESSNASVISMKENMFTEMVKDLCKEPGEEPFKKRNELADDQRDLHNCLTDINEFLDRFLARYQREMVMELRQSRSQKSIGSFEEMSEKKKREYLDKRLVASSKSLKVRTTELRQIENKIPDEASSRALESEIKDIKAQIDAHKKEISNLHLKVLQSQRTFAKKDKGHLSEEVQFILSINEQLFQVEKKKKRIQERMEAMKSKSEEANSEIKRLEGEKGPLEEEAIQIGAKKTEEMKQFEKLIEKKEKLEKAVAFLERVTGKYDNDKRFELNPMSEKNAEVLGRIRDLAGKIDKQRNELISLNEFVKKNRESILSSSSSQNLSMVRKTAGKHSVKNIEKRLNEGQQSESLRGSMVDEPEEPKENPENEEQRGNPDPNAKPSDVFEEKDNDY